MAYFAPYLDETGLHIPTYGDRLEALLSSYRAIFGADVNLTESSPDYQLLSVFARALDDFSSLLVDLFASRNPAYASGAALDLLLPLAGLLRSGPTCSTVSVTLTGTPGAVLSGAPRIMDSAGLIWACSSGIHLGDDGTATVQASCETPGAVSAPAGSVCHLVTQIENLVSATNPTAAVPGVDAETDASARERMRLAATAPARTSLEALYDEIMGLPLVRGCKICVNDDAETDSRGIPGHSLCVLVSGGGKTAIGKAIFKKKAPGIGTFGTTSVSVTDSFGFAHTVRFRRPTNLQYTLNIYLTPREGFDEANVVPAIRQAVYDFVSSIGIGEDLVIPTLYGITYSADTAATPTFLITRITACRLSDGVYLTDVLPAGWDEVCALLSMNGIFVEINS